LILGNKPIAVFYFGRIKKIILARNENGRK
jgi:hypothetical protein